MCATYFAAGDTEGGFQAAHLMATHDPLNANSWMCAGAAKIIAGQFEEALPEFERGMALDPQNYFLRWCAGYSLAALGRTQQASRHAQFMLETEPEGPYTIQLLALIDAIEGRHRDAISRLSNIDLAPLDSHTQFHLAEPFALSGDHDRALDMIGRTVDGGFYPYPFISTHCPFLAPLRSLPRFAEIAAKSQERTAAFLKAEREATSHVNRDWKLAVIGTTLAHYRITAALGSGGMGEVWRATDTKLGREVALKVLPEEMAADPERLDRFRREAMMLASLDHPGVVGVYSVEESEGQHFLTMQLVEGESLDGLIPSDGMAVDRILEIASAVAEALAAAHDRGIVHRDLKPANVMVAPDGQVKVLDFGLAKIAVPQPDGPLDSEMETDLHTREGVVMGTVPYMSPEQVSAQAVDLRTDIFSLGVMLYEMASGQRPFGGRSTAELSSAILRDTPPSLSGRARLSCPMG